MPQLHSKYEPLLTDKSVRRWHENICRGSRLTGWVYLRRLGAFCNDNGVTPSQLVRLKQRALYNLLLDHIGLMERKGLAGSYAASVVKSVKSWLAFNGVEVKGTIRIRGARETPTLHDERVPTQAELRSIFLLGDEKTRATCALMAHSGVRPEVLGNSIATDGLRVGDVPDLEIKGEGVSFKQIPAMVIVRASLSKTGNPYFTFLAEESCEYLKSYLEMRLRSGEGLTRDSAIITPKIAGKPFISTINISDSIRKVIRAAGFPWRPYVLRSYFATQMMLAESKAMIIRDWRVFFMGHNGGIEAVYTLNKRRLSPEVIDQMREGYRKAQRFLQTVEPVATQDETAKSFRRQLLLFAGFKPDEIKDDHLELDEEAFQKLARAKADEGARQGQRGQKVVAMSEIEGHLINGWEFVSLLPDNRAIIRMTNAA